MKGKWGINLVSAMLAEVDGCQAVWTLQAPLKSGFLEEGKEEPIYGRKYESADLHAVIITTLLWLVQILDHAHCLYWNVFSFIVTALL